MTLEKKTDGYFVGSNFPVNENLIREETDFDPMDMSISSNARHVRWDQLMAENKGKIDIAAARAIYGRPVTILSPRRMKPTSARSTGTSICRPAGLRRGSRRTAMRGPRRIKSRTRAWSSTCHLTLRPDTLAA